MAIACRGLKDEVMVVSQTNVVDPTLIEFLLVVIINFIENIRNAVSHDEY